MLRTKRFPCGYFGFHPEKKTNGMKEIYPIFNYYERERERDVKHLKKIRNFWGQQFTPWYVRVKLILKKSHEIEKKLGYLAEIYV